MANKKKVPVEAPSAGVPTETEENVHLRHHAVYVDDQQQNLENWQQRMDDASILGSFTIAANRGTIANSVVSAVDFLPEIGVCWVCYEGPVSIYIPYEEAFDEPPTELMNKDTRDIRRRKEQFLQKSIGAPVSFIITKTAESDGAMVAIASRQKANAMIRRIHYGAEAQRPLKAGDTVRATVMGVGNSVMCLSVAGKDIIVSNRNLTHRYVDNLQTMWSAGQSIRVTIRDIEHGEKRGEVKKVSVTCRDIELEEAQAKIRRARKDMKCFATVVSISSEPFRINLWLNGLDIPAYAATRVFDREQIRPGCKVMVRILGTTERGYVHCEIVYAQPSSR